MKLNISYKDMIVYAIIAGFCGRLKYLCNFETKVP